MSYTGTGRYIAACDSCSQLLDHADQVLCVAEGLLQSSSLAGALLVADLCSKLSDQLTELPALQWRYGRLVDRVVPMSSPDTFGDVALVSLGKTAVGAAGVLCV